MCPLGICPITHASKLSILIAVAVSFVFGFLWYGPLFGKSWAGLMGIKMDPAKCGKPPLSSLLLTILGTFLTTMVLAYLINTGKCSCSVAAAFFVWLGFYVPQLFGAVTWEGKPWRLFALNAAYALLNLQIIAAIVAYIK